MSERNVLEKRCPRCGQSFLCGATDSRPCWCAVLPPLKVIEVRMPDCLCPDCLKAALLVQRADRASE